MARRKTALAKNVAANTCNVETAAIARQLAIKPPELIPWPPQRGDGVTFYSSGGDYNHNATHARAQQATLGLGWRNLVVLKTGRKYTTLFSVAGLTKIQMTQAEWEYVKPRRYAPSWSTLRDWLVRNRAVHDQYGLQYSGVCADDIAALIEEKTNGHS